MMDLHFFKDHILAKTLLSIYCIITCVFLFDAAIHTSCLLLRPLIWSHHFPTNNVNTVTLFLMYRVIRISCLLRAILAELRSGAIRNTQYIRKRVTVLSQSYLYDNIDGLQVRFFSTWRESLATPQTLNPFHFFRATILHQLITCVEFRAACQGLLRKTLVNWKLTPLKIFKT